MRIVSVGGGPAGLYFAILAKQAFPDARIEVYERNPPGATHGWGVVFSDETLGNFMEADAPSFHAITGEMIYWTDIETFYRGEKIVSTGHGFSGFSRRRLLEILQDRATEVGVEVTYETEIDDLSQFKDADLVLAADGVNSKVRTQLAEHFQPTITQGTARFTWLGTDLPLSAFTFIFEENEHGLFQVHAYPFEADRSTFIVECHEDVWQRAGLDQASEEDTVAYCEKLFAKHLGGHKLLTNKSIWRSFPVVENATWHHDNVVLVGDAAHTAHFSIGSGTKLAMEDAIALVDALVEHGTGDIPQALAAYQEARELTVLKTQKAARTSQTWFENSARYLGQAPLQFTFNLLSRSKKVTYDNLELRDPAFIERIDRWYMDHVGATPASDGDVPPPVFTPAKVGSLTLNNRIVVSPMCQYSADDGTVNDWHLVHLGSRAIGGPGLLITEMADVSPEGRITQGCAGMWNDAHVDAWKRVTDFVHGSSQTPIGIQLAHAGRKASCHRPWDGGGPLAPGEGAWDTLGPSAIPFDAGWHTPRAMDRADMDRVTAAFAEGARRAERAGFDAIELHMAHGYLLSEFISPLVNRRTDAYGGDVEARMRYPLEVLDAVRAAWPDKPLLVRISASDWLDDEGGLTIEDSLTVARLLEEHGCDCLDVSSGGNVPGSKIVYGRMYQVPFAEQIKAVVQIPVMTVGAILGADHANTILAAGRADLCAMARPHLRDPYLTLRAASDYGYVDQPWPPQYERAKLEKKR